MQREGSPWRGVGVVLQKELADHLSSVRMLVIERAGERIAMRRELREHTDNLKRLVRKQAARLVEVEKVLVPLVSLPPHVIWKLADAEPDVFVVLCVNRSSLVYESTSDRVEPVTV